jgi:hypothetical protein
MANRNFLSQNIHDRVIHVAANNLQRVGKYHVYRNPGAEKNTRIGNLYPDIILTPPDKNDVLFVIEVETSDSVNANEALTQWKPYSNLGGTFYLLVPQQQRILAENICRQYGIVVKFGTYTVDNLNQLTINYE